MSSRALSASSVRSIDEHEHFEVGRSLQHVNDPLRFSTSVPSGNSSREKRICISDLREEDREELLLALRGGLQFSGLGLNP